jgi:Flp pilus assembly protein TadG
MNQLPNKQQGAVLILVVAAMVAMFALAGLALDGGHAMLNKTRLQNTVDAAALSGAKELDLTDDTVQARAAAISAFAANAAADGNHELQEQFSSGAINITVQFSATLNPFVPGSAPAEYVRVRAQNFRMPAWFASIVGVTEKQVGASAVAGPSPTINTACNIAPMMVCGDPDAGAPYWGYTPGEPDVLKMSVSGSEVGVGNFQLIRLGDNAGAADIRVALAGGYDGCASAGEMIDTEPGNTVGPVVQGINTRFGLYSGPLQGMETTYPPDVITKQPSPEISYNPDTDQLYAGTDPTDPTAVIAEAADIDYNYDDYNASLRAKSFDKAPPVGQYLRREIAIPVGDCSTTVNGQGEVPLLGFGCYFLLQEAKQKGNDSYVFGQFIRDCNAGGLPGPLPGDGPGLYIIQLYKDPDSPEA